MAGIVARITVHLTEYGLIAGTSSNSGEEETPEAKKAIERFYERMRAATPTVLMQALSKPEEVISLEGRDTIEILAAATCKKWEPGMSLLIQPLINGFGLSYVRLGNGGFKSCDKIASDLAEVVLGVRMSSLQPIKVDSGWPDCRY
jgi:hypothetical protein